MSTVDAVDIAIGAGFLGIFGLLWVNGIRGVARRERAVLHRIRRVYRAHYAAIEAAEDDPAFSPAVIDQFVAEVVALAVVAWRTGRWGDLRGRPDAASIKEWAQSRQSWLGSGIQKVGKPMVDLLRIVRRADEAEDRIVVRVRLRIRGHHLQTGLLSTRHAHLDERWTLGRSAGHWVLLSAEDHPFADPVIAPSIPAASFDNERLLEESLIELSKARTVSDEMPLGDLVRADEAPAAALLDLSALDGRFEPALIAAELGHLVEAWETATTGSEAPLEKLASADARRTLLRPRRGARLVMHDAVLNSWEIKRLDVAKRPPTIEVSLQVDALRYVVTSEGEQIGGLETVPHQIALSWLLELSDSEVAPWQLVGSNNPARGIPGWR